MAERISPLKKFVFSLITLVLGLIVILTVNEIIFRLVRGAPNPLGATTQVTMDSLFEPGTVMKDKSNQFNEFTYTATINSHGYRGPEFSVPKPEGVKRIMVVGDSFTFGVGSNDDETIPALVQQQLRANDPDVEVINAGAGHASPIYHYVNMQNFHLKNDPDLVILMLDLTDIQDDWRHEGQAVFDKNGNIKHFDVTYENGKRSWWRWLTFYCASWLQFDKKVLRSFEKKEIIGWKNYKKMVKDGIRTKAYIVNMEEGSLPEQKLFEYDGLLFLRGHKREALIRKQFKRTAGYLDKIKGMLDERGIPMILVAYPYGIYVGADEWNEGRFTWGFEKDRLYTDHLPFEIIGEYSKSRGIPYINTTPKMIAARRESDEPFYFNWDGHMTPAANKVVAKEIATSPYVLGALRNIR